MKATPQYQCQSWYDEESKSVKDCTCGKCANDLKKPMTNKTGWLIQRDYTYIPELNDGDECNLCGLSFAHFHKAGTQPKDFVSLLEQSKNHTTGVDKLNPSTHSGATNTKFTAESWFETLKDNPDKIIEWAEAEIKEYKRLITIIKCHAKHKKVSNKHGSHDNK